MSEEKIDGRTKEARSNRAEVSRDTEVRNVKKTRRRKNDSETELYVNPSEIPDGFVVEWKRTHIYGKEDKQNMIGVEKDGWEPANPKDFPSLVGKNHKGSTITNGKEDLMLMIRPKELTDEAKAEELQNARNQVKHKFEELGIAQPGQAPRQDSHGNNLAKVRVEYAPIPVE